MQAPTSTDARRAAWLTLGADAVVYVAILFAVDWLRFPVRKDEVHFWPTALSFSHTLLPTLEQLRSYNELSTPLPFVLFGFLEHLLHGGIIVARAVDLLLSLGVLLAIQFAPGQISRRSLLCSVGLVLCPYFVGMGTHLYTEMLTIAFVLGGMHAWVFGRTWLASLCFLLAVSCRQYAVAFPLALLLWNLVETRSTARLLALALPIAGLVGWFIFWGGPGPRIAIESQFVATQRAAQVLPEHVGYFLACVGLYYVVLEALFFRESRASLVANIRRRSAILLVAGVVALFCLFPPLRNPVGYPYAEMGFLDKALRFALSDGPRIFVLGVLASVAVIRFSRLDLATVVTYANALLMLKAHIAWDKYALPLLVVLWWLKAREPSAVT